MPHRIQRQRTKGWKKPANTVCVTRPGPWGNPFRVTSHRSPADAIAQFTVYAHGRLADEPDWLAPLRGQDLACWCPLLLPDGSTCPCHGDILLILANQEGDEPCRSSGISKGNTAPS
jgi:Domain of unknown function (DUF4326)